MKTFEIRHAGNGLILDPRRAIWWPLEKVLLVSDLHIGKISNFRISGKALPMGAMEHDIQRLNQLIDHYNPEKIICLGDLFHSSYNAESEFFRQWLDTLAPIEFVLIEGNHDLHQKNLLKLLNIETHKELKISNIKLIHQTNFEKDENTISGHYHAGVKLRDKISSVNLPAFVQVDSHIILPAFTELSGNNQLKSHSPTHIYAISDKEVTETPVYSE